MLENLILTCNIIFSNLPAQFCAIVVEIVFAIEVIGDPES